MDQDPPVRAPVTRRALAKQQTRRRLLEAATRLVAERGYEAATLRDVAALADVSTGAVFANFADKADLFNEVIVADLAALLDRMKAAAGADASPSEALLSMLTVGYASYFGQLSLVKAQMGFSWFSDCGVARRGEGVRSIVNCLADILRQGVESGTLTPSLDPVLVAEMAWNNYLANYRHAILDGWTLDVVRARMAAQIDVLLGGYQTGQRDDQPAWPGLLSRGLEAARRPAPSLGALHSTAALRG